MSEKEKEKTLSEAVAKKYKLVGVPAGKNIVQLVSVNKDTQSESRSMREVDYSTMTLEEADYLVSMGVKDLVAIEEAKATETPKTIVPKPTETPKP